MQISSVSSTVALAPVTRGGTSAVKANGEAAAAERAPNAAPGRSQDAEKTDSAGSNNAPAAAQSSDASAQAEAAIRAQVLKLQARDREVRAHEQAHLAVAGRFATSGPSFTFQTGPDGQRYAVGGEVGIDTSPISGDPQATIDKARQVRAAALAPAQPSGPDLAIAAQAASMEQLAQAELARAAQDAGYRPDGARDTPEAGRLLSAFA